MQKSPLSEQNLSKVVLGRKERHLTGSTWRSGHLPALFQHLLKNVNRLANFSVTPPRRHVLNIAQEEGLDDLLKESTTNQPPIDSRFAKLA